MSLHQSQQSQNQQQLQQSHHDGHADQCNFCPQTFAPEHVYVPQQVQYIQSQPVVYTSQVIQQPVVQNFVQQQAAVVSQTALQSVKGQSRIEYIPYQRTEVEYKNVEEVVTEDVLVDDIEYQEVERRFVEYVPREVVETHYQTIEYQKEYIPRKVYDTVQEQVPVTRVEYVPVQRTEYVEQSRVEYVTQTKQVPRTEYDEIEYQVTQPQIVSSQVLTQQQPQVITSQVLAQPVQQVQHLEVSQVIQQPTTIVQQQLPVHSVVQQVPVQTIAQPTLIQSNVQYAPVYQQSIQRSVIQPSPITTNTITQQNKVEAKVEEQRHQKQESKSFFEKLFE